MTLLYTIINPQREKKNNILQHLRITSYSKKGEAKFKKDRLGPNVGMLYMLLAAVFKTVEK